MTIKGSSSVTTTKASSSVTTIQCASLYGLDLASFNVLLKRLNTSDVSPQLPPFILSKIQRLRDMASEFSDMATPYVIANDPLYYSNIGQTIEKGLFELNYNTRDVSRQVVLWRRTSVESMGEEDSDYCLGEIFGTRNSIECAFTDKCWSLMTQFGYNGYSLSHEIFFLEIAEGYGCQKEVQQQIIVHKQPALTQLQDTFCANMLDEANRIAQMGFPPSLQDLFMEQAALCGMLGFREFFNNDWLTKILSWQDAEDGCYKWSGWNPEDFSSRSSGRHSRNKREEKRVYRGCLCHRSTVAASALSQYVRYILEVWLKEHISFSAGTPLGTDVKRCLVFQPFIEKSEKQPESFLTLDEKDQKRLFEGNALLRRLVRIGVLDEGKMKSTRLGLRLEDFLNAAFRLKSSN
ncbi:hypothetical protein Btru_068305 [Bulinus truncatus]|nr:hypothetical protein Btru_068305 [Bulinus truncatus]